jgi:N,N'-diacetyllegionaminate synthase
MFLNQKKIFIVAEAGNNHEGDIKVAKKLIDKAVFAGADAIKFQTFKPENFINNEEKKRLKQLQKFSLDIKDFKELSNYAKKKKIIFFSTPLDLNSAKELNKFQKFFKISSGDNNYFDLIKVISDFKKPMIISTGLADMRLIKKIYVFLKKNKKFKISKKNFAFLHCVSSYPVPIEQANLLSIKYLMKKFKNISIGYSDHTVGMHACLVAASLGVQIIEKHFTIDNNFSKFRDHRLSLNPINFKKMVEIIREIELLLGKEKKIIQKCEKEGLKSSRRSLAFNKKLPKGSKLSAKDLFGLRPEKNISIEKKKLFIGKITKKNVKKGEFLSKLNIN